MSNERFNEKDLLAKGFVPDGKGGYVPKCHLKKGDGIMRQIANSDPSTFNKTVDGPTKKDYEKLMTGFSFKPVVRKIPLTLFGIPMAKQSVRSANGHFWQPKKYTERVTDYVKQIRSQLPADFKMFEHEVHITKMHFVFPPLKKFQQIKGRMAAIRAGEIFYKNTKPDLPDNLKKLCNDAMSDLVYKDDSLIVTENNVAKYYGTGGMIVIEMEGY